MSGGFNRYYRPLLTSRKFPAGYLSLNLLVGSYRNFTQIVKVQYTYLQAYIFDYANTDCMVNI